MAGPAGRPGTPGEQGTITLPSDPDEVVLSLVQPNVALLARRLDVTIALDGPLDLTDVSVSFGAGVDVQGITKRSRSLVASIDVAADAPLGSRDVVVTTPDMTLVARRAFSVAAHLDVKIGAGKAEQGGVVRLDITNRDTIPFSSETFSLFPLVMPQEPSVVGLAYQSFTATDGSVFFLGDPLAKPGPLGFYGSNDMNDPQSPTYVTEGDAITITTREPLELTSNTSIEQTFSKELETGFFTATLSPEPGEGLLVEAWARVPPDSTMSPVLLAYPKSGHSKDLLDQSRMDPGIPMLGIPATDARIAYPVTTPERAYFIVIDEYLAHGPTAKLSLIYRAARAALVAEQPSAHATAETAQDLGVVPDGSADIPGLLVEGNLEAAGESDVYKLGGFSSEDADDVIVSLLSDGDVIVRVDTSPTFDSENLIAVGRGGKAGMNITSNCVGENRWIQVTSPFNGGKLAGKYSFGIKRTSSLGAPY